MSGARYEDRACRRVVGADAELLRLAIQLGLKSFEPGHEGASFAPAMLLFPSRVVVSTTRKLRKEGSSIEDCVAYLRDTAPSTPGVEGYAIVTDARETSPDGACVDTLRIELASLGGGFHVLQPHAAGRASGRPDVHALFDSPLLSRPSEAEVELAVQAFAAVDAHRPRGQHPLALVLEDAEEDAELIHLEASDSEDAEADYLSLASHVFGTIEPCAYALAFDRHEAERRVVQVEVGEGKGRAFVFERGEASEPTLWLVARRPALWKRMKAAAP